MFILLYSNKGETSEAARFLDLSDAVESFAIQNDDGSYTWRYIVDRIYKTDGDLELIELDMDDLLKGLDCDAKAEASHNNNLRDQSFWGRL